jgi:hypothetical protein
MAQWLSSAGPPQYLAVIEDRPDLFDNDDYAVERLRPASLKFGPLFAPLGRIIGTADDRRKMIFFRM